jgi:hypothetical protein
MGDMKKGAWRNTYDHMSVVEDNIKPSSTNYGIMSEELSEKYL